MSAEAIAYVATLLQCPDGAELTCTQKCILFCMADHHNRSTRRCNPSQQLLVTESLTSKDTVQRALSYLERHAVVAIGRPTNQGRGRYLCYTFLALDAPQQLALKLEQLAKGPQAAPLFSPPERGVEGEHTAAKGEQKGSNGHIVIRKNHRTVEPFNQGHARLRAREPAISQAERDSLDLKRWQAEMKNGSASVGRFVKDPDADWRHRARSAAYRAGVSPARLLELLRQHFPADPNLPLLYPELAAKPAPERKAVKL
jgi:hypothetical protein